MPGVKAFIRWPNAQESLTVQFSVFIVQWLDFSSFNFELLPVLSLVSCSGVMHVVFKDASYTATRGIRNQTFSFPCVRKRGIVRLGYDRTIIFLANSKPLIDATESYKESR